MGHLRRRRLANALARATALLLAVAALVPLVLVIAFTLRKGLPTLLNLSFFLDSERPVGIPGSGVAHAIVGTGIMVSMASAISIPVGVMAGVYLNEYGKSRTSDGIRLAADVLVGTPSIAAGLFAYGVVVAPFHRFSAVSASVALAILMVPVVVRTTEAAFALVPHGLRESGLALGLPRWRVSLQLLLAAALPGVITGSMLAVARAAGETAPLLFTSFGNEFFSLDPSGPMASLPLVVFHDALTPYPELQAQAWGAALLLVLVVVAANLATRFALRERTRLADRF